MEEFFSPPNMQRTAQQVGGAVVEHGPTALEVGGQVVSVGAGITSAVAMAAGHPEVALPAGAIAAAGGGASAIGKSLKGQGLDQDALAKGAEGVVDMTEFMFPDENKPS